MYDPQSGQHAAPVSSTATAVAPPREAAEPERERRAPRERAEEPRRLPYALQVGAQVCAKEIEHGVIIRPLADTIVIVPPLMISMENLDHLMDTIERCINEVVPHVTTSASDGLE